MVAMINHSQLYNIIFGDFNDVRSVIERLGLVFCASTAKYFNDFVFLDKVGRHFDGRPHV